MHLNVLADGVGFHGDVVAFELAVQRGSADPQHLSSEGFIAVGLLEHAENCHAFHLREGGG